MIDPEPAQLQCSPHTRSTSFAPYLCTFLVHLSLPPPLRKATNQSCELAPASLKALQTRCSFSVAISDTRAEASAACLRLRPRDIKGGMWDVVFFSCIYGCRVMTRAPLLLASHVETPVLMLTYHQNIYIKHTAPRKKLCSLKEQSDREKGAQLRVKRDEDDGHHSWKSHSGVRRRVCFCV